MFANNMFIFVSLLMAAISAYVSSQVAPSSNAYLPPTQGGYNYPTPSRPLAPSIPGRPTAGRPTAGRPTAALPTPGLPAPGPVYRPTASRPIPGQPAADHVHMPGNPFDFEYAVQDAETANNYAHKASSNGDVVTGEYRVQLPDGRTQVVRYTADWKTGYHADVSYQGEIQYPQGPNTGARGGGGYRY